MKQRILMNLITIVITLALLASLLSMAFYVLVLQTASSPDCNSMGNSMVYCEPSRYIPPLLMWGGLSALFIVVAIVFTREKRNKQ